MVPGVSTSTNKQRSDFTGASHGISTLKILARFGRREPRSDEETPQEEDAYGVFENPSLPTRDHFRYEEIPFVLGEGRSGRATAPHRDPGEDLVSEPKEQVEEANRRRARRSERGPWDARTANAQSAVAVPRAEDGPFVSLLAVHHAVPDVPLSVPVLAHLHDEPYKDHAAPFVVTRGLRVGLCASRETIIRRDMILSCTTSKQRAANRRTKTMRYIRVRLSTRHILGKILTILTKTVKNTAVYMQCYEVYIYTS